jgi:translocation and assembly module TamA
MVRSEIIIFLGALLAFGGTARGERVEPYSVSIHLHGEKTDGLHRLLWDNSTAVAQRDSPPPTATLLEAIARDDARKMKKILRAESFYTASVRIELKDRDNSPRLYFSVTTGPPFRIRSVEIENAGPDLPEDLLIPSGEAIGLPPDIPGTSAAILGAETALLNYFRRSGYPAAALDGREVVVDYADGSVSVTYRIDPGPRSAFGETFFSGLEEVREKFVRRQIPWDPGQIYDPDLVQTFRNRLARTGLFTTLLISADPSARDPAPGEETPGGLAPLDIRVTLRERAPHTFGLEGGYSTDIGFGGAVSWEDRNLFGRGDLFRLRLFGSEELYYAEGQFRIPAFLHPDQSLNLAVQPVYDRPRAYDSYRWRLSALLRREFSDAFVVSGGTAYTFDRVKQFDRDWEFFLVSLPLNLQLKIGGDQPFHPAGALFLLQGEPYCDLKRENYFIRTMATGNFLYRIPGVDFLTALARATVASLPEANLAEVPADLRFYAGGANSIRGYAYQKVGPMIGKDPVGGLSLFTASFELNCQVLGDFGVAAFLDGGAAFLDSTPRFGDEIRWGTGVGLRYFTPIGPIGLDLGFPIEPRRDIDSAFQVYISIAQIY